MIDMGEIEYFLGIHITCNKQQKTIHLNQTKYINNILNFFCKESCKSIFAPLETMILNLQRTNLPHLKKIGEKDMMVHANPL